MLGTVFDLFVRKTDRMKKTAKPEEHVPPSAERAADPPAALDQRLPPEERVVPTTGELSETAKDALEDEASAEARTKQEPGDQTPDGGMGIGGYGV